MSASSADSYYTLPRAQKYHTSLQCPYLRGRDSSAITTTTGAPPTGLTKCAHCKRETRRVARRVLATKRHPPPQEFWTDAAQRTLTTTTTIKEGEEEEEGEEDTQGWVYVLCHLDDAARAATEPCMHKIGRTARDDPFERLDELERGNSESYVMVAHMHVPRSALAERLVHEQLAAHRKPRSSGGDGDTEWFDVSYADIRKTLAELAVTLAELPT